MGLRADREDVLEKMRAVYADHLVEDDRARGDFGITVARRSGGGPRLLPYVARGTRPLLWSRSTPRLLRRLDLALGELAAPSEEGVRLRNLAALVHEGRAVLVPSGVAERSSAVERQLATAGVGIAEAAGVRLDPGSGEVIVVPGLARATGGPLNDDGLAAQPGRHALAGVFWTDGQLDHDERPATVLIRLLRHIGDRGAIDADQILRGMADVAGLSSPHGLADRGVPDLGPLLDRLGTDQRGAS